jgi:hypothetical protein
VRENRDCPFIKHFMIPASVLAGRNYQVQPSAEQQFVVYNDVNYQDEFPELLMKSSPSTSVGHANRAPSCACEVVRVRDRNVI